MAQGTAQRSSHSIYASCDGRNTSSFSFSYSCWKSEREMPRESRICSDSVVIVHAQITLLLCPSIEPSQVASAAHEHARHKEEDERGRTLRQCKGEEIERSLELRCRCRRLPACQEFKSDGAVTMSIVDDAEGEIGPFSISRECVVSRSASTGDNGGEGAHPPL